MENESNLNSEEQKSTEEDQQIIWKKYLVCLIE